MELLAPAGNWEAFLAAINNGADAVYLGGQQYSARQSAENFSPQQMREALDYAHVRDKKVYVTVNTLIANSEFAGVLDYLFQLESMGVDAVILQDMGLLQATRAVLPQLRLHASTQMTIHNAEGASFLRDQGVKRVVLAREMSAPEIMDIKKRLPDLELEIFVHGALCFCYSGQCLFSSMVGGRSGNRGRCAQPCRLPYELHTRASDKPVILPGQGKYLLSPADLCLIEYLPEIAATGVSSLKIEGRMKRAEYVAVVTKAYREVLDQLAIDPDFRPDKAVIDRLLRIFNRNFTSGYFIPGPTPFLSSSRPNNRGTYVGRVVDQDENLRTMIKITAPVSLGDGLTVWVGQGRAPAAIVKEILVSGRKVAEAEAGETIQVRLDGRVFPHDRVFKTHDQKLLAEAQASIKQERAGKIPVDAEVYLSPGQKMRLALDDRRGNRVEVETRNLAQPTEQYPLDAALLRQKIARLGNTDFELANLIVHGDTHLLIPFSDINDARRRAADMLTAKMLLSHCPPDLDEDSFRVAKQIYLQPVQKHPRCYPPSLSVLVSGLGQAKAALEGGADRVYLAMEARGVRGYEVMRWPQGSGRGTDMDKLVPLMPRIHKSGDKHAYRAAELSGFRSLMVSSWADLDWALASEKTVYGDYSLNIFNRYTLEYLLEMGVNGACLSPELNFEQLESFPDLAGAELLVHGELILMESEYCLLGGAGAAGRQKCMAPCQKDQYYLRDSKGFDFPLETDADCRFYLFNSRTLCMMEDLERIISLGPSSIRIEARRLGEDQVRQTVRLYRLALDQIQAGIKPDLQALQKELVLYSDSAFTKGHYYRGVV